MSSHLAAFRVEVGLQKVGMKKTHVDAAWVFRSVFKRQNEKDRQRWGGDNAYVFWHTQLPDMAGTVVSPIILLILIFTVDWRMGLASLVPIILGFITMKFMTSTKGKQFQKNYFDSLEEMSSESVEYVRGIPVVKTFGQSIFSFKRFYNSIIRYKEMVHAYTLLWRKPMSFYTIIMQSAAFFLIPHGDTFNRKRRKPRSCAFEFHILSFNISHFYDAADEIDVFSAKQQNCRAGDRPDR